MDTEEQSVLSAADRLVAAFGNHETEGYFSAFTEDASFIFHNLDRTLKNRAEYETEWQLWETRDAFRVLGCRSSDRMVQLVGDVAIFTHTVATDVSVAGEAITNLERETIAFRRNADGRWLAFHEHLSPLTN
jgi:ketosteroid isomerase-like protein